MSETNGILTIGLKGKKTLRFEDEHGQPILEMRIDIVATHNAYTVVYRQFVDETGECPRERLPECNEATWNFVRQLIASSAPRDKPEEIERAGQLALDISLADALDFIARLTEEAIALQSFFSIKLPGERSSPARTETVVYSQ